VSSRTSQKSRSGHGSVCGGYAAEDGSTEIALTSHEQKVIKGMDDALLKLQVISDGFYDKEIEAVAESVILVFTLNEAILARTKRRGRLARRKSSLWNPAAC
jgi:hypothetical protein